jgi:3-oxoacyl-[acyl-carrier-protein] synthase II
MRRIVVTGLGVVSPFGAGVKAYWAGLAAGLCAIRPLTLFDATGFRCGLAGEVPDAAGGSTRRSRADRLALAAAGEALDDAGLDADELSRTALVVGAVGGGMFEAEAWYWARARGERVPGWASALRSMLPGSHAAALDHRLRLGGPRQTVVTACSSGAVAVAEAADLVADGVVDVAVAGGIDAVTRMCFMGFNALKLLDPQPCRPFDRDRRGMSIGEGAAFLVLEDAEHARPRAQVTPSSVDTA